MQSIRIPSSTNMIRLKFVNDYYRPGCPDTDRNAFIDFLVWNNQRFEAESFDQTGGLGAIATPAVGADRRPGARAALLPTVVTAVTT